MMIHSKSILEQKQAKIDELQHLKEAQEKEKKRLATEAKKEQIKAEKMVAKLARKEEELKIAHQQLISSEHQVHSVKMQVKTLQD